MLRLREKILQVETSLDWEEFSKMDRKEQELVFTRKLQKVVIEVAIKYKLDINQIELAFTGLLDKLTQEN